MKSAPEILYQGLLASPASWAHVGRGFVRELTAAGWSVGVVSPRGFLYEPSLDLTDVPHFAPEEARDARFGVGFLHPPHLDRLVGRTRANFFVWEADRIPQEWVPHLEGEGNQILVPSEFTRGALIESGVSAARIALVPFGVVPPSTQPVPTSSAAFDGVTFLSVVAPHYRKGVEELLTAYRQAFRASDRVRLVIKSTYDPADNRRRIPAEIPSWAEARREAGLDDADAPALDLRIGRESDAAMAALFAECDVYVGPSWGESFGLAHLEAAAHGRPVIATDWGGVREFLPPGPDRLPYRLVEDPRSVYVETPGARVARPDIDALVERLRAHVTDRVASRTAGAEHARVARRWTWSRATRSLLEALRTAETASLA